MVHLVLGLSMADEIESLCMVRERSGDVKSLKKPSGCTTLTKFWGVEMK